MQAFVVPTEYRAVDKMSATFRKMQATMNAFTKSAEGGILKAERAFEKYTPTLTGLQKHFLELAATASIVAATIGGLQFSARSLIDYETAMHSLQAVTGVSNEKMKEFDKQILELAHESKKSAIDVAGSFEIVGSAMSQYLEDPKALRQITEAGITLSKAARMELEPSLDALTNIMNQFDLGADKATDTINRLTAGEIVGQVRTAQIAQSLQEFGATAKSMNVSLSESTALIEVLGKKLKVDKIGVASRNILTILSAAKGLDKQAKKDLQSAGVNLDVLMNPALSLGKRLTELKKIEHDNVKMVSVFGKENLIAGQVILGNLDTYMQWEAQIEKTNKAQDQAATNSDTFANAVKELQNEFVNTIVSTGELNNGMSELKTVLKFAANNMGTILKLVINVTVAFLAFKILLLGSKIVLGAYNILLGVYNALFTRTLVLTTENTIAQKAYIITSKIGVFWLDAWAKAQLFLNGAMTANPIGLIIVGVAALITLVVTIIKYWNEWGAAVSLFLGPIGFVISLIQSFRRNWDMVVNAFKTDGILGALKAIGKVMFDALLQPIQQLLGLISKLTGAEWAANWASGIESFRKDLGVNVTTDEEGNKLEEQKKVVNLEEERQKEFQKTITTNNNQNLSIDINDGTGRANVSKNTAAIPVRMSTTQSHYRGGAGGGW